MKRFLLLSIVLFATTAFSQTATPKQRSTGKDAAKSVPAPVRLDDELKGFQARVAKVGSDVYVSGQPSEEALRELKKRGVTTVVNLRTPEEMAKIGFNEEEVVKSLGMKYVYLPVRGNKEFPYSTETLTKFADAMKSADGGVLLHCTIAWRASHLWAAYLIQERGFSNEEAIKHARLINLMDDHRMTEGRQPVELFVGREVPGLGKPQNQSH